MKEKKNLNNPVPNMMGNARVGDLIELFESLGVDTEKLMRKLNKKPKKRK